MSAYSAETYNYFIQDLKSIEKTIQSDLKELKINAGTNVNTFNTENSVRKGLENYLTKVNKTYDDYKKNSMDIKYTIPEREYSRRVNEILEFKNNYERIKSEFDSFLDIKYKYVSLLLKFYIFIFHRKEEVPLKDTYQLMKILIKPGICLIDKYWNILKKN